MHKLKHMKEHTPLLSRSLLHLFLPLFPFIVLCPNPLCSLQFHLKSFTSLNKILHLSFCLSHSSSHPTPLPLYLVFFSLSVSPLFPLSCFSHMPLCDPFLTFPVFYLPLSFFTFLLTSAAHFLCLCTDCQFEIGGWDGIIRSSQVEEEERVKPGDALDCIWTIRAPPQSKVSTTDQISHQKSWDALL